MKKFCNSQVILFLALKSVAFLMIIISGIANINASRENTSNGIAYAQEIEDIDRAESLPNIKENPEYSANLILEASTLVFNEDEKDLYNSAQMSTKGILESNSIADQKSLALESRNSFLIGGGSNIQGALLSFSDASVTNIVFAETSEPEVVMPTVEDYTGDDEIVRSKIEGTDQWNDLIYEVATEEGVDPVFVKCIMAQESAGQVMDKGTKNNNGSRDYGLMQVNSSWGDIYDYDRMLTDHRYAIWAGIDVLKGKSEYAQEFDKEPTIFNVSWFYNGYSKDGKKYAEEISSIYEDLTGNNAETTEF